MILPLFLGLLTGPQLALFTVLYTVIVLIVLQVWLEPRLFKLKGDNPILTFVIILAMADALDYWNHYSAACIGDLSNSLEFC